MMQTFSKSGAEVSQDTYKALRSGNRAAKAQLPAPGKFSMSARTSVYGLRRSGRVSNSKPVLRVR